MADSQVGYVEPGTANQWLDAETTGRTHSGNPVVTQRVVDLACPPTLTARMLAKAPAVGYELWVDSAVTTNQGAGVIMSEAPTASSNLNALAWNGVFIPTAAGRWIERSGFAWNARTTGW